MIRSILIIWIIALSVLGCDSKSDNPDKIPDGIYTGTFQRQLAFGGGEVAQVSLTFSEYNWTGQSDKIKYPALCNGSYKLDNHKIIITNNCGWTAEFDWSLILGGDYDFSLNDNQLTITRSYLGPSTDTFIDKYILTRQK